MQSIDSPNQRVLNTPKVPNRSRRKTPSTGQSSSPHPLTPNKVAPTQYLMQKHPREGCHCTAVPTTHSERASGGAGGERQTPVPAPSCHRAAAACNPSQPLKGADPSSPMHETLRSLARTRTTFMEELISQPLSKWSHSGCTVMEALVLIA